MKVLKVRDNVDLVREDGSRAILNTNAAELTKYKAMRDERLKLNSLIEEQKKLRCDLDEIKLLLKQLVGKVD